GAEHLSSNMDAAIVLVCLNAGDYDGLRNPASRLTSEKCVTHSSELALTELASALIPPQMTARLFSNAKRLLADSYSSPCGQASCLARLGLLDDAMNV